MPHALLTSSALLVISMATAAPAQECAAFPLIAEIGAGTPGSAGVPELHSLGQPMVNQPGMGLRITGGAPGAAAQIVVGAPGTPQVLPAYGARLYPNAPFTRFPVTLGPDGVSPAVLSGPAPTSPALCGLEFVAQGVVTDPMAQGGLAFTGGMRLRFGVGSAAASLFQGAKFRFYASDFGLGYSLGAGDLNGDGRSDLVAPIGPDPRSGSTGGVQVVLQLYDGSLWLGDFIEAPGNTPTVAVLDLDDDGVLDLLIATAPPAPYVDPGSLGVYRGVGDGTFEAGQVIPTPGGYPSLATADLNGDGLPEVAVWPWSAQGATGVFENLGSGMLGSPVELATSFGVVQDSLRFADMDGDGRLDLVGLVQYNFLLVAQGLGGTSFGPPQFTDLATENVAGLDVADLDADGDSDVVVGGMGLFGGSLRAFLNTGNGQLASPIDLTSSFGFYHQAFARDLDGDGLPEILSSPVGFKLLVVPNLGGGAFGPAQSFKTPSFQLLPVDMNGDGTIDIASRNDPFVQWVSGAGDGTLDVPPPLPLPLGHDPICPDVDLDGHLDLVTGEYSGALQVRLGAGDGTFGSPIESAAGSNDLTSMDIGLIDGDALPDAVVTYYADAPDPTITILIGQGSGQFLATDHIALPASIDVRLADVDADGDLDMLTLASGALYTLLGAGDGTFGAPLLAAPLMWRFDLGDVNEDGLIDVVGYDADYYLVLRTGVGDGTFAASVAVIPDSFFGSGAPGFRIADLDLDGHLDLLHGGWGPSGTLLSSYRGDGRGAFTLVQTTAGLTVDGPITIADFNGDGAPDIMAAGLQLGFGDATFAAPQPGAIGGAPADVDEDGDLDVVQSAVYLNSLY